MKMILKLGGGALVATMAISAAGCSKSGVGAKLADASKGIPTANSAAPVPPPPQNPEDKMPRINVEEAKKLVAEGKAIIIDVRGPDVYKISHIKGAVDFPLNKLESGDIKSLPTDKRIIAYCG